jgi:thiamine biosynthesis lipoprotein
MDNAVPSYEKRDTIPPYRQSIRLAVLCTLLSIVSCSTPPQLQKPFMRLEGKAQGTTFSIVYADSLNRSFATQVDSLFRLIDKSMSLWDTTSIISHFNKNIPQTVADEHFEKVFRRSIEISKITEGVFDVTVAPLVKRWGFYFKKNDNPPDDAEIKNLLTCCGWQKVRLANSILIKENPCIQLDFNAIAQGYTVDLIAQYLENQGITHYMVEIGGEVRTLGKNETGTAWQIGIDKPLENESVTEGGRPLQRIVSLSGKSMATSGSYRKFIVRDGKKYSHMIDPHTGKPVQHNLLSASVIADNCADADAYATAFMVMGLEKAKSKAAELGVAVLLIFQNEKQALEEVVVGDFN